MKRREYVVILIACLMSWFCWYFEEASCGFTPGPEKGELGHSEGAFRNIESGCLTFYFNLRG
ncbi:hypothetical protein ACQJBY_063604 [Aegilops geniculata]